MVTNWIRSFFRFVIDVNPSEHISWNVRKSLKNTVSDIVILLACLFIKTHPHIKEVDNTNS